MSEVQQQDQGSDRKHKKVRAKKTSTRIDMTPMVDLAFLLLTFFMLTTILSDPYVIKIEKPDPKDTSTSPPIKDEKVITLVLGEKNKIYWYHGTKNPKVNLTNYSGSGIRKILFEKKAQIKGLHIFIKPSDKSKYKNMIDILDEMLITEITQYSLVKITPEDSRLIAASKL